MPNKVKKIQEMIVEYGYNPDDYNSLKIAQEIDALYKEHSPDPSWHQRKNIIGAR